MALPQAARFREIRVLVIVVTLLFSCAALMAVGTYGTLTCTPSPLQFGSVALGSFQTLPLKLSNTGSVTLTITKVLVQAVGFQMSNLNLPVNLAPGKSISLNITFAPQTLGQSGGTIAFFSTYASNSVLFVTLAGSGISGADLTAAPASQSFGSVKVGASATHLETITNAGSVSLSLAKVLVTGSSFSMTGLTLPLNLAAGHSVTFSLVFAPTSTGSASGTLSVTPPTGSAVNVALKGTGTSAGQLGLSPSSLSFGNVVVGNTSSSPLTLSATGASVTIDSASLSSSEFTLSGISFPVTIAAGKSSTLNVVFQPQSSGSATGKITFGSTAANSSAVESVSGSGEAASAHQVVLSWKDSNSGVAGYNIYRGAVSGSYTRVNTALDSSTTYTDATVEAGSTYYYATTAVNNVGVESTYSSPVKVVIPSE